MDSFGCLVMQYKVSPTVAFGVPHRGVQSNLWKANADGSPKLPIGVPSPVLYHPIWGHDVVRLAEREKFISVGLFKCVEF